MEHTTETARGSQTPKGPLEQVPTLSGSLRRQGQAKRGGNELTTTVISSLKGFCCSVRRVPLPRRSPLLIPEAAVNLLSEHEIWSPNLVAQYTTVRNLMGTPAQEVSGH